MWAQTWRGSYAFNVSFLFSLALQSCDLWSLGVIIYVMLCGYPPFYSKHHSRTIPKDMRKKIMTGSFDFPEDEWSQISEMAKDIVRKWVIFFCLALSRLAGVPEQTVSLLRSSFTPFSAWCRALPPVLRCPLQAAEGEARGEADHRGSPGSPLAQLHRGPRQRAAVRPDDDGQGEGEVKGAVNDLTGWGHCWTLVGVPGSSSSFPYCLASSPLPGRSRWYPAGPCGAAGQHEDPGSDRQPEAFKLCEQPNPQEAETTRVRLLFLCLLKCLEMQCSFCLCFEVEIDRTRKTR